MLSDESYDAIHCDPAFRTLAAIGQGLFVHAVQLQFGNFSLLHATDDRVEGCGSLSDLRNPLPKISLGLVATANVGCVRLPYRLLWHCLNHFPPPLFLLASHASNVHVSKHRVSVLSSSHFRRDCREFPDISKETVATVLTFHVS